MATNAETLKTSRGVPFLRTPEENFADLVGYDFTPNYVEFEGLRLHYVDAGPRDGPIALLMHGMPTWSYLNRHIIRSLVDNGWRCIAPDHIGFGRSDKVIDPEWYSIRRHTQACRTLIDALDLEDITVFVQDWGGPTGLAQAAETPDRFARLVVMNTWLPHEGYDYSGAIRNWAASWQPGNLYDVNIPERLTLGTIMSVALGYRAPAALFAMAQGEPVSTLSEVAAAVVRGYDAPHRGLGPLAFVGPRRFPLSIPIDRPNDQTALDGARHFRALKSWSKPIHFVWGGADAIFTEAWGRQWAAAFPQATFDLLPDAAHFLQETHGEDIARIVLKHVGP